MMCSIEEAEAIAKDQITDERVLNTILYHLEMGKDHKARILLPPKKGWRREEFCGNCGFTLHSFYKYCPNCGFKILEGFHLGYMKEGMKDEKQKQDN